MNCFDHFLCVDILIISKKIKIFAYQISIEKLTINCLFKSTPARLIVTSDQSAISTKPGALAFRTTVL